MPQEEQGVCVGRDSGLAVFDEQGHVTLPLSSPESVFYLVRNVQVKGSSEAQNRHGKGLTGKVVHSNELARTITQLP
jgi:hypothetical protein